MSTPWNEMGYFTSNSCLKGHKPEGAPPPDSGGTSIKIFFGGGKKIFQGGRFVKKCKNMHEVCKTLPFYAEIVKFWLILHI